MSKTKPSHVVYLITLMPLFNELTNVIYGLMSGINSENFDDFFINVEVERKFVWCFIPCTLLLEYGRGSHQVLAFG